MRATTTTGGLLCAAEEKQRDLAIVRMTAVVVLICHWIIYSEVTLLWCIQVSALACFIIGEQNVLILSNLDFANLPK